MELARQLREFGENNATMEQYAILKFAEVGTGVIVLGFFLILWEQALEVVPRILLDNSGVDSTHAIASLVAAHQKASASVFCPFFLTMLQGQKYAGVSIETGSIQDAASELQVLDSLLAKRSAIQLATDAATTILRVDQVRFALTCDFV